MKLYLGNTSPVEPVTDDDGHVTLAPMDGNRVTTIHFPEERSLSEAFTEVTAAGGLWAMHTAPNDDGRPRSPAWVAGDHDGLVDLIADHYGCKVGAPKSGYAGLGAVSTATALILTAMVTVAMAVALVGLHLRTAEGRNFQARVMGNSAGVGAGTGVMRPADYLALTENAVAPADADTALTGELIDTGLERQLATFAHSAGANSYTLTRAYTSAAGNVTRTVAKYGCFNAATAGSLVFTSLISPTATIAAGDQLTLTVTVSLV